MAKTKILATLGPASWDKLDELIKAGLDGFRINMSHVSDYAQTSKLISDIRIHAPYAFIATDLEGPKIRLGTLEKPIPVKEGEIIHIAPQSECPIGCVPVQVEHMYKHLNIGNSLLINDGAVKLRVKDIKDKIISAEVLSGEQLESRKGINVPDAYIPMDFLSDKDKKNLDFLMKHDVDYISASFTQKKEDIAALRKYIGNTKTKIIAKIENPEGIQKFEEILYSSDAVMVARGDMGMEIGVTYVPETQKKIIYECNMLGVPVITATQMLESMIKKPESQRAEVSDIFNAVQDGTDIVMLSGETSVGKYPIDAVNVMNETLERAEKYFKESGRSKEIADKVIRYIDNHKELRDSSENMISKAVNSAARTNSIAAIITPTKTGYTPQQIAKFRPDIPVIALTQDMMLARQLNAIWGVSAYKTVLDETNLVEESLNYVSKNNLVPKGSQVIVTAGMGQYGKGATNVMRIEKI